MRLPTNGGLSCVYRDLHIKNKRIKFAYHFKNKRKYENIQPRPQGNQD